MLQTCSLSRTLRFPSLPSLPAPSRGPGHCVRCPLARRTSPREPHCPLLCGLTPALFPKSADTAQGPPCPRSPLSCCLSNSCLSVQSCVSRTALSCSVPALPEALPGHAARVHVRDLVSAGLMGNVPFQAARTAGRGRGVDGGECPGAGRGTLAPGRGVDAESLVGGEAHNPESCDRVCTGEPSLPCVFSATGRCPQNA